MAELIAIPLKKPFDVDIKEQVTNVIQSTHGGTGEDYADAIAEFSKLRNDALWCTFEKHESHLQIIYRYYDQLCALERKIPTHELQIPFKWKDAFGDTIVEGKHELTISTLAYEKICVLFNIAALQSSVAATQSLDSYAGLELSAKLFQQSAGIFNYLNENVINAIEQKPTQDISPETLGALSTLMLAQAQEIFVLKAIHNSMNYDTIAGLTAQAKKMYMDAFILFLKISRFLDISWGFSWAILYEEWMQLINSKKYCYLAMTYFYESLECKNNEYFREAIFKLECAVKFFDFAQLRCNKPNLFQDYANKAQRNLMEVKKYNDLIYYKERISDITHVETIRKVGPPELIPLPEVFSTNFKDLFVELLPLNVRHASSADKNRRNELVNYEIPNLCELRKPREDHVHNDDIDRKRINIQLLKKCAGQRKHTYKYYDNNNFLYYKIKNIYRCARRQKGCQARISLDNEYFYKHGVHDHSPEKV